MFAIPEMLEAILIELGQQDYDDSGMKELFVLQRVNSTFRDMIKSSPKLRRIMFMPGTDKESDIEPTLNPLCFDRRADRVLYPAILDLWDPESSADHTDASEVYHLLFFKVESKTVIKSLRHLRMSKPGSWREMKLCHCATGSKIDSAVTEDGMSRKGTKIHLMDNTQNTKVRLGEFADAIVYKALRSRLWNN